MLIGVFLYVVTSLVFEGTLTCADDQHMYLRGFGSESNEVEFVEVGLLDGTQRRPVILRIEFNPEGMVTQAIVRQASRPEEVLTRDQFISRFPSVETFCSLRGE